MTDEFKALIAKVATGASLSREEAASAFDRMMSGEATPSQMGGLLMALRVRGETVDEITGAVSAMRALTYFIDAEATTMPQMIERASWTTIKRFLEHQALEAGRQRLGDLWQQ